MVYFIITFCGLAIVSLLVFIFFSALAIRTIKLVPAHQRPGIPYKTACLRSILMAVIWLVCALGLHLAMTKSDSFKQSLPTFILLWDVPNKLYGATATDTLYQRCVNDLLAREEVDKISGLIMGSQWWQDFYIQPISELKKEYYKSAESWFYYVCQTRQISHEHLQAYINKEPPPVFHMVEKDNIDTGFPYLFTARFGRNWQVETDTPYVIDSLEITDIRIDDASIDYDISETELSESAKGYDATLVEYEIVLKSLSAQKYTGSHKLVIEYRLGLIPRSVESLGPFVQIFDITIK